MKKRTVIILLICLLGCLAAILGLSLSKNDGPPVTEANAVNAGVLLADLANAAQSPTDGDAARIESDLEAIRAVNKKDYRLLSAIAGHWQQTYLDPGYPLYLYHGDDNAPELADCGIPGGAGHAIVVLGYALQDGCMQPELKGRCDAAAAAARAFPDAIIVCSGGATGENNPDGRTEAGLMKAYLSEECGIDPARIHTDEEAMTTLENAVNTFAILRKNSVNTMTIVTSVYHQRRGQMLYRTMAELCRRRYGYSVEMVGNYNYDTEPASPMLLRDARIAASQIAGMLELPDEAMAAFSAGVSPASPPKPSGNMETGKYVHDDQKAVGQPTAFLHHFVFSIQALTISSISFDGGSMRASALSPHHMALGFSGVKVSQRAMGVPSASFPLGSPQRMKLPRELHSCRARS